MTRVTNKCISKRFNIFVREVVAAVSAEKIFERMSRMDTELSLVNLNPGFISSLLLMFIIALVSISAQLSTELNQVMELLVINFIDKPSLDYSAD